MSIEREQPFTAFRSMAAFMKLGDIKGEFQADELTGTFNALNETTNVRPSKGESISIVHPAFKTGYDTDSIDSLSETFGDGDPRILGPISGEGVFKPQDIDTKGSVIVGDNHFTPDRGGDSVTGEGRPTKIWTNGGASTFEDRHVGDYDANDAVFSMRENISSTAGPGGSTFMTETFEPAAGMNSFGESLNPVLELGANSGPGGTSYMTGQFEVPTDNLGGSANPGGDDI